MRTSKKPWWVSFVEEMVMNPDFAGYIGGRMEVYSNDPGTWYAEEEVRFLTKKREEFWEFRERWDFHDVTYDELDMLKKEIAEKYYEEPKVGE